MIKRISLIRRKEGMTREAFIIHWMGAHAAIVRQLPGLRGLRFDVVLKWSPEELAWDGVGELWFDSIAHAEQAFIAEPFRSQLTEDREKFVSEVQWCFVEEQTAVRPPPYAGRAFGDWVTSG
jgi:uncharacterized protein (TIGR02118 family)